MAQYPDLDGDQEPFDPPLPKPIWGEETDDERIHAEPFAAIAGAFLALAFIAAVELRAQQPPRAQGHGPSEGAQVAAIAACGDGPTERVLLEGWGSVPVVPGDSVLSDVAGHQGGP